VPDYDIIRSAKQRAPYHYAPDTLFEEWLSDEKVSADLPLYRQPWRLVLITGDEVTG
jgi:hypothetical protein